MIAPIKEIGGATMAYLNKLDVKILILLGIISIMLLSSCIRDFYERYGIKNDNIVEQTIEEALNEAIESQIGINPDIDFTPYD